MEILFIRAIIAEGFACSQKSNNGRFLDECVKAGLLRLCDSLACDVPFIVMLLVDDVWTSPDDWIRLADGKLR